MVDPGGGGEFQNPLAKVKLLFSLRKAYKQFIDFTTGFINAYSLRHSGGGGVACKRMHAQATYWYQQEALIYVHEYGT